MRSLEKHNAHAQTYFNYGISTYDDYSLIRNNHELKSTGDEIKGRGNVVKIEL